MQEHKVAVVERIHPEKPDHQDCPEFQAARKHEAFLQLLRERPTWMADKYFNGLTDQVRRDFDESIDKTKRYWARHPDLFLLHFGNSRSSSEDSGRQHSALPTQVSSHLAEEEGYGRDQMLCDSMESGLMAAREDHKKVVKRYQTKILITRSDDYKTFTYAPRPQRKQRIGADFENMIEGAEGYDPIPSAAYDAGHDASDRSWGQPGNYETFQNR